jgi:hypothetical protein
MIAQLGALGYAICNFFEAMVYSRRRKQMMFAGVAQLVEHLLAKEKVAGSNPVSRSIHPSVN